VKGYIRHDMYVQQITEDFGPVLEERYGPGLGALVRTAIEDAVNVQEPGPKPAPTRRTA
jgi:hypothetical protein